MKGIKSVLAVLVGIAIAAGLFMAVEALSAVLHPWPDDFSGSFEEVARQVESYPAWVLVLLGGVCYGAIMLICTFVAARLGPDRHPGHGYAVAIVLFGLVVFNLTMLPYPTWFWVLSMIVLPLTALVGTRLGSGAAY
ncbi:MAG: hypothetical protein AAF465_04205 [Pseudomonadota bacterium]